MFNATVAVIVVFFSGFFIGMLFRDWVAKETGGDK
jgi:hypothetical protein